MMRTKRNMLGLALVAVAALLAVACGSDAETLDAPGGTDNQIVEPSGVDDQDNGDGDETLILSLGDGAVTASCMQFDVAVLADMSPAFAGTVSSIDGETVTLAVDTWYAGGDASVVTLQAPAGLEALVGGIDFEVGEQYLITAADGVVNYCGYSAPATVDMVAAFDEAFGV